MNIEEAKANIGKEVVYIGDETPCLKGDVFTITSVINNLVYVKSKDLSIRAKAFLFELKHPTFKAGDQVVLDESTKPYTYGKKNRNADKDYDNYIGKTLTVIDVDNMGVEFKAPCGTLDLINPRHLKLAPQQEVKDFDASEQVLAKPKYHTEEMRKYRDEVAKFLLANGVPFDETFKHKIDMYVDVVILK